MSTTSPPVDSAIDETIQLDLAVIGGGIAGLWLINRLTGMGYDAALFETHSLGSQQTVASQGMIHGGVKYTLSGALSGASESIADMPAYWQACLKGQGDVNLTNTTLLSDHFFMWSGSSASARLTTFFASKALRGRIEKVKPAQRPPLLQHEDFNGALYRLVDIVLDVPGLLQDLASQVHDRLFKLNEKAFHWRKNAEGEAELLIRTGEKNTLIKAGKFIFSAGMGNGELLSSLGIEQPRMQLRPLQQVMVLHDNPHAFYGHCLGTDKTPRLTISSHKVCDGRQVWYLGGSLAEKGASQSAETLIGLAKEELQTLMPWVDLQGAQWATLPVNRAEPEQKNLMRPDTAFAGHASPIKNVIVTWPTKLTLVPNMANETLKLIQPDVTPSQTSQYTRISGLTRPGIAQTPWEAAFGTSAC